MTDSPKHRRAQIDLKVPYTKSSPRPRRRNCNEPGHAHELTFSCYHRHRFLQSDMTCEWLAESINQARTKHAFDLWAYVFMPEHVHIIVYPREPIYDIAVIRKAIKAPVAAKAIKYLKQNAPEWLPRMTRGRGDKIERLFWQSGAGYDRNIEKTRALLEMIEYIHLNPVRRGLVERASDWKWSSARWFHEGKLGPITLDPIPRDWLLDAK